MIPCVTSFPRVLRVGSPRPSNKLTVPARTCLCRYSSPSTRLRVFPFDQPSLFCLSVWLRFAPARLIACVLLLPVVYYIVPPYRPSRFCSSVWLRFAPARLIASVVLWPRGLTTLSLRTGRLILVRRCGCVSLLPALSRPSSCGPVALLIFPPYRPFFPSRRIVSSRNISYTVQ